MSRLVAVALLLAHHVRDVVALIPASPEDTAALTREVVRAIAAWVEGATADAEAMGRRIAGRPCRGAPAPPPPVRASWGEVHR